MIRQIEIGIFGEDRYSGSVVRLPEFQDQPLAAGVFKAAFVSNYLIRKAMKKLILFSVLGMMLLSGSAYASDVIAIPAASSSAWVNIRITFHRPKLECKRGFGICFEFSVGFEDNMDAGADYNTCPVRAQLNEKNQLILQINDRELTKYEGGSTLSYFKDKTSLTLEDPYTLSGTTSKALGSTAPLTIRQGVYPVSYNAGVYTVIIQL